MEYDTWLGLTGLTLILMLTPTLSFSDLPRAPAPLCDHGIQIFDKSLMCEQQQQQQQPQNNNLVRGACQAYSTRLQAQVTS